MNAVAGLPSYADPATLRQAEVDFDPTTSTLYWWMKPAPRPCFNAALLHESMQFEGAIQKHGGWFLHHGREHKIENAVFGSRFPGVFNLGGDLEFFVQEIIQKNRPRLHAYAHACIENMHRRISGYDARIVTYSLVQGKAFGGGFECALASEYIVAEASATFSFPEVLFNMFPGMGALTLLSRRIGITKAEDLIMSGRVFTAREMHELHVVDEVVADGQGLEAVNHSIRTRQRRRNAYRAVSQAKRVCQPVSLAEMQAVVDIWVDAALALEHRDLRMMARLARAQDKTASAAKFAESEPFLEIEAANQ
ncbi:MAG: enoyl-CoA hydratase/isomerase family protein [Burkholderiales bacterium]|nr:enoyl-CoA hydratase/isomerase family protein [Burkholderiales bacterium]